MSARRNPGNSSGTGRAKTAAALVGICALAVVVSRALPPRSSTPSAPSAGGALRPTSTPGARITESPPVARHLPNPAVKVPVATSRFDLNLGVVITAIALVILGVGAGFIGVAVASQRRAPLPPPVVSMQAPLMAPAPRVVAPGRTVEGWSDAREVTSTAAPSEPEAAPPSPDPTPTLPASKPASVDIPVIDVHSPVRHLGQADDGSLQVPAPGPHYNDAAWYRHSPAPGSLGPAILMGHVDSAADGPSVFFRLGELRRGNRIIVTRADGSTATFVVDRVRRYAKAAFPTNLVYRDIDHAGLRVLTCGGAFDSASGHYLDNIVVFASLVGSR